jgi:hypothetical protein
MDTDLLDEFCENLFGHDDWEQVPDKSGSGDVIIRFKCGHHTEDFVGDMDDE